MRYLFLKIVSCQLITFFAYPKVFALYMIVFTFKPKGKFMGDIKVAQVLF